MCLSKKKPARGQSKGEEVAHCLVVVVVVVVFTRPAYKAIGMLPTDVIQTDTGAGQPADKNTERRNLFIFLDENKCVVRSKEYFLKLLSLAKAPETFALLIARPHCCVQSCDKCALCTR